MWFWPCQWQLLTCVALVCVPLFEEACLISQECCTGVKVCQRFPLPGIVDGRWWLKLLLKKSMPRNGVAMFAFKNTWLMTLYPYLNVLVKTQKGIGLTFAQITAKEVKGISFWWQAIAVVSSEIINCTLQKYPVSFPAPSWDVTYQTFSSRNMFPSWNLMFFQMFPEFSQNHFESVSVPVGRQEFYEIILFFNWELWSSDTIADLPVVSADLFHKF